MSNVDHPNHYNIEGRKECIDEMVEKFGLDATLNFCWLNCYKYLYRAGEKEGNSAEQDIAKAAWYLNWADAHEYELTPSNMLNELLADAYDKVICGKVISSNIQDKIMKSNRRETKQ